MTLLFEDFGSMFESWPEPPETIPLQILGLKPSPSQRDIKSAFRAKVIEAHPDLKYAFELPAFRQAAEKHKGNLPEIRELVWARDVLIRMAPAEPIVTADGVPTSHYRYPLPQTRECPKCQKQSKWCASECDHCGYWFQRCPKCGGESRGWMVAWRGQFAGWCVKCRTEGENERRRELRRRRRANRTCRVCGSTFTPKRSDGRYCSPSCRQRGYRERKAAITPPDEMRI